MQISAALVFITSVTLNFVLLLYDEYFINTHHKALFHLCFFNPCTNIYDSGCSCCTHDILLRSLLQIQVVTRVQIISALWKKCAETHRISKKSVKKLNKQEARAPAIQVKPDVEHYFASVIGRAGVCAAPSAEVEICGICTQIKGRTTRRFGRLQMAAVILSLKEQWTIK